MNKKQLLSITMLLSVVSLSAGIPSGGLNAVIPAEGYAAAKALKAEKLVAKSGMFSNAWSATKNGTQYSWDTVKSVPGMISLGAGKTWNGIKATPGMTKTAASDVIEFAKVNPTTSAVRTGALAGAGYVVYRQAGNVTAWVKENPKKAATLVALAGLGYYKGDIALDAAKSALSKVSTPEFVNTAISYVPARPGFVNTGLGYVTGTGSTVASYLPTRPDFVNTGLGYVTGAGSTVVGSVTNNPYTAAAYAATAAQGVSDYVGLGSDDETATETATETVTIAENRDLFTLTKTRIQILSNSLSNDELIVKLQETRNWVLASPARARFLGHIDAEIAKLS